MNGGWGWKKDGEGDALLDLGYDGSPFLPAQVWAAGTVDATAFPITFSRMFW